MSEARDLVEQHNRIFNERAWSRVPQICSPDLEMVEPAAGTVRGIEPFIGHAQVFVQAFPDSRLEIATLIDAGDRVVVEGVFIGTHTGPMPSPQGTVAPTGRTLSLPYCEVFEVAAGRITTKHVYYDQMTFAAQLGLLPEPAQTA